MPAGVLVWLIGFRIAKSSAALTPSPSVAKAMTDQSAAWNAEGTTPWVTPSERQRGLVARHVVCSATRGSEDLGPNRKSRLKGDGAKKTRSGQGRTLSCTEGPASFSPRPEKGVIP